MKSLLTWLVLSFLAFVTLLAVVGMFLSKGYKVERRIHINADQAKVHELVSNLDHWENWGPWSKNNPEVLVERGAISSGVGASQSWSGQTGEGHLVFTRSDPQKGIGYDLHFNDGAGKCLVVMAYNKMDTDTVEVVWNFTGEVDMPIVGVYFAQMMDGLLGPMLEENLASLKELAESSEPIDG